MPTPTRIQNMRRQSKTIFFIIIICGRNAIYLFRKCTITDMLPLVEKDKILHNRRLMILLNDNTPSAVVILWTQLLPLKMNDNEFISAVWHLKCYYTWIHLDIFVFNVIVYQKRREIKANQT